jgi:uncharacterized membrane protein
MREHEGAIAPRRALAALAVMTAICLGGSAWGQIYTGRKGAAPEIVSPFDPTTPHASSYLSQLKGRQKPGFESLPPEERPRMQQQFREWQSLPPDQKDAMRRRMEDWNRMPPNERDRYQQRYQQWQQLSPDERRQMENHLRRWDNLSPQERNSFRQRFRQ